MTIAFALSQLRFGRELFLVRSRALCRHHLLQGFRVAPNLDVGSRRRDLSGILI